METKLKVWEIETSEKEWVAAYTAIHAMQVISSLSEISLCDFCETDEVREIPKEKWKEYQIFDIDTGDPVETFADWMERETKPDMIASTCF